MQERATPSRAIHRPRALHLLLRTRDIDLSRILHQEYYGLFGNALPGPRAMRFEDFSMRYFVIVEETVCRS